MGRYLALRALAVIAQAVGLLVGLTAVPIGIAVALAGQSAVTFLFGPAFADPAAAVIAAAGISIIGLLAGLGLAAYGQLMQLLIDVEGHLRRDADERRDALDWRE